MVRHPPDATGVCGKRCDNHPAEQAGYGRGSGPSNGLHADGDRIQYIGADDTRYIPVDQEVELNLGAARNVRIKPVLMNFAKQNFLFDNNNNITGFDELRTYEIEVHNLSERPAVVEIRRNVDTNRWRIEESRGAARPETIDQNTFEYKLELAPHSIRRFDAPSR